MREIMKNKLDKMKDSKVLIEIEADDSECPCGTGCLDDLREETRDDRGDNAEAGA